MDFQRYIHKPTIPLRPIASFVQSPHIPAVQTLVIDPVSLGWQVRVSVEEL